MVLSGAVSVFVQLSSNGRAGILYMLISWEFAQGWGAQFAFFEPGGHLGHRRALRTCFLSAGTCAVGGEKKMRKGEEKEYKINKARKEKKEKDGPNRLRLVRKIEPSSGMWT
jgi:hypothetical protein